MTTTHHAPLIVTKPSPLELALVRTFDAPRHLVWAAYTEPRHIQQWMLGPEGWTMPICEQDLRPGGRWRYVWRRAEGDEMEMTGEIREVVPTERLVMTESWGGDWAETVNTMVLTEADGRTTITSTMLFPTTEARDRAAETGMADGAGRSFDLMDDLLATMS